jgi:hypothetical protein
MWEDKQQEVRCQAVRFGRVILKSGPCGTGAALLPVSVQDSGTWRVNGLLKIEPRDVGLRRWPSTRAGRRRLIRRAIRSARKALEARA